MNELPKVQTKTNTEGSVLFFNSLDEINKYLMMILFIQFIRFSYTTPSVWEAAELFQNTHEIFIDKN